MSEPARPHVRTGGGGPCGHPLPAGRGRRSARPLALLAAGLVCAAAPAFFVARLPWAGWLLLAAGLVVALLVGRASRERGATASPVVRPRADRAHGAAPQAGAPPGLARDLSLIALGLLVVSSIPLEAALDDAAMLRFAVALGSAVALPYAVSRFAFRDRAIRFPWRGGGRWGPLQWGWLGGVLVLGWLLLPFYFIASGSYRNWPVVDSPELIGRLFVGVGAVGLWDELFFVCTVFALLRRHFPDWQANLLQAVVFVSFLWELGYRSWGPLLTIPFALLQGVIFVRTRSLAYVVSVHLLFDAVVFAVLVHAHNPGLLSWLFLVSP